MLNRSAKENKKTDNNLRRVILRTGERNDAAAIPPFLLTMLIRGNSLCRSRHQLSAWNYLTHSL